MLFVTVAAFALAAWVFLRAQGVETWEATRRAAVDHRLALIAMVLVPVMLADHNYDRPAPPANHAPAIRGLFARVGERARAHRTGRRSCRARCCGTILNRDDDAARHRRDGDGEDLFVLLPVDVSRDRDVDERAGQRRRRSHRDDRSGRRWRR